MPKVYKTIKMFDMDQKLFCALVFYGVKINKNNEKKCMYKYATRFSPSGQLLHVSTLHYSSSAANFPATDADDYFHQSIFYKESCQSS